MQLAGSDEEKIRLALPNVPPLGHWTENSLLSHDSDSGHRNERMLSEEQTLGRQVGAPGQQGWWVLASVLGVSWNSILFKRRGMELGGLQDTEEVACPSRWVAAVLDAGCCPRLFS